MTAFSRSLKKQSLLAFITLVVFGFIFFQHHLMDGKSGNSNAVLTGSIYIQPQEKVKDSTQTVQLQPGKPILIRVVVENKGNGKSLPTEMFVRFAFAKPLDKEKNSSIFESEKKQLPALAPGEKLEVTFEHLHQLPSIIDFVRYDWLMREYQAIVISSQEEAMIGSLALTFSAYYYPGIRKEFPTEFIVD